MRQSVHIIRLRGPWQFQVLSRWIEQPDGSWGEQESDDTARTVRIPWDGDGPIESGVDRRVSFQRAFGCPSGIGPQETVELVLERTGCPGSVWLNGKLLGDYVAGSASVRYEVTSQLLRRNALDVQLDIPRERLSQVWDSVHLEIHHSGGTT